VLEIGCGTGDLLASLEPAYGVGLDLSGEMIKIAQRKYPHIHFVEGDILETPIDGQFDFVILSDVVNDLWDVQKAFEILQENLLPHGRIIINYYSHLWEFPLSIAKISGMATPLLYQNWLTNEDIQNLLHLENMEVVRTWREILFPLPIPGLSQFFNKFLVKISPFQHLGLVNFLIGRKRQQPCPPETHPSVSVIVPARNEEGNIENIFKRTPEMGSFTELVFVEGHSTDNTYDAISKAMARHPDKKCKLFQQTGKGKGDAVRLGFSNASGDILMILDADLTVPPEDLPRFYQALVENKGEFINGVRLVYPMEKQAMRFINFLGNKFFSLAFSWLLGQPVKDTLCGTKVLWKADYEKIASNRAYFGDFDPFGDFDLLFGAAKLGLKIVDLPIRYRERTYGTTNIQRWKHGMLLLRMVLFAAGKIKFT
jgi:SAM-dependent methyltransferase